jgi:hypothetical protein
MAVELIAAWLLREAYKLIVVPVGTELRQRLDRKIADRIAASVPTSLFHAQPPESDGERANESEADAGLSADTDFVDGLEKEPEVADAVRGELEGVLGVSLGGAGVRRGTPEWYVSAYAAILWRIAMLAVWENRPIAINGALQGTEWVTVSMPLVQQAIVPSKIWRRTDDGGLLRALGNPQVEFFVRQSEDERSRQHEVADLNERFMIAPKAGFKDAEGTSVATDWHRIDGLSRKWVRLKLDPATEAAIIENTSTKGLFGEPMFIRNLTTRPPEFDEYPAEWKPLLTIPSEARAIAVLSAGADAFARASDASADAVEAVLSA